MCGRVLADAGIEVSRVKFLLQILVDQIVFATFTSLTWMTHFATLWVDREYYRASGRED